MMAHVAAENGLKISMAYNLSRLDQKLLSTVLIE
jgi:hypothetical protein